MNTVILQSATLSNLDFVDLSVELIATDLRPLTRILT